MRTSIILSLAGSFLAFNLSAQNCLPESKISDEKLNLAIANVLKENYEKNKVSAGFKQVQAEYLRHSIVTDWKENKNDKGLWRFIEVLVAIKADADCRLVALPMVQEKPEGAADWSEVKIKTSVMMSQARKLEKAKEDCDCIYKNKDWLGRPVPVAAAPAPAPAPAPAAPAPATNTSTAPAAATNNQGSTSNTTTAVVSYSTAPPEASKLAPFNKKKLGYYEVKANPKDPKSPVVEQGYKAKMKKEGECRKYSAAGVLEQVINFKGDLREGAYVEYYPSGKVKEEGNYKAGNKDGSWKIYYESGVLNIHGGYKNDKQEGEWKRFRQDGKLVGMDYYENGVKQ